MTLYTDLVCPFCGCLCDDIAVEVKDGEIHEVRNACELGYSKIAGHHTRYRAPMIRENGKLKEVSYEEAIEKSAEILASSKRVLYYGWSNTTCEAQKIGVHLAELTGGVIDNTTSVCHGPSVIAIHNVGYPGTTLGQVKNRANLIIYWGCNPLSAHPRHLSRYTTYPRGFFRQKGYEQRYLVVVDVRETDTAKMANKFIKIEPNSDYSVINALRAILRGHEDIIPSEVGGVPKEELVKLVERMKNAEFGALFFGLGLTMTRGRYKNIENAIKLVEDLNRYTKFTLTPMRGHYNVTGFNIVCAWETGYPFAVDFSRGYPCYNPGETTAVDVLLKGDLDALFVMGSDPAANFPKEVLKKMAEIPVILIDPFPNATSAFADVIIPSAINGVEAEGTAYRMDSVPIRLRKFLDTEFLSDEEIMRRIYESVERRMKG